LSVFLRFMLPHPTMIIPIKSDLKYRGNATVKLVNEDSSPLEVVGLTYESPVLINEETGECPFSIKLVEVSKERRFRLAISIDFFVRRDR